MKRAFEPTKEDLEDATNKRYRASYPRTLQADYERVKTMFVFFGFLLKKII
jgi:trans-aconitate methyltransferase